MSSRDDPRLSLLSEKRKEVWRELQDARWYERDDEPALARELHRIDNLISEGQLYDPEF